MIRLRPYKPSDSRFFLSWMRDELEFQKWCASQFEYPLTEEQLSSHYQEYVEDEHGWGMTALNETGKPVGYFLMRLADYEKESVHLGFVIVDPAERGKGNGLGMIRAALCYAFDVLLVKRATLAVFENNPSAHNCYRSAGFRDLDLWEEPFEFGGEIWQVRNMEAVKEEEQYEREGAAAWR